jgi:GNAT superfamily N-acetyltransferase
MAVDIRLLDDPDAFLDEAGPLLLADEARHNLLLGIVGTIHSAPGLYAEQRFWVVTDGDDVVAAALRTPPYNLVLARPRDDAALEALVAGIEEELPGVVAAHPEVDEFTRLWSRAHEIEPRVLRDQGICALQRVQPVPATPGTSRAATREDEALLLDWMVAFGLEVLHENDPGGFVFWEDGGNVVSVSGWGGPTPNGIRIGPVYTPPERRGRGYATALVAELSQNLLDGGRSFCFLFTDLANPTSNAIYERIGAVRVCEAAMVAFEAL